MTRPAAETPAEAGPASPAPRRRWLKRLARALAMVALAIGIVWAAAALYFDVPIPLLRGPLAAVALAVPALATIFLRPAWRVWLVATSVFLMVFAWWASLQPSNQRNWQPDVATLPYAEWDSDRVVLRNIRDCTYRSETDYDVRLIDRTYDLNTLQTVDLFVVYWGSPWIAHTMLSFGFANGEYLCCSIEVRKEKGEGYSAIRGFFRQFELTYILATERDVVRLRTDYREGEEVYLYRIDMTPEAARRLFREYLSRANELKADPEWYNALTSNCTTNIRLNSDTARGRVSPFDWRILLNGKCDEFLFEKGAFPSQLPFPELRKASLINPRANAAPESADFSHAIRAGLPTVVARFQP